MSDPLPLTPDDEPPRDPARDAQLLVRAWLALGVLLLAPAVLVRTPARGWLEALWSTAWLDAPIVFGAYLGFSLPAVALALRLRAQARAGAAAPPSRRLAALAGTLALWGGTCLWTVACLEGAAATVCDLPNLVPSWRVNHTWTPNGRHLHSQWIAGNPDFPEPYRHVYNAQGWLETYDVTREKPPGTYRIFYVGDSQTEGCVPMEQSVPSVVEQALNARSAGPRFEVVNTGTSSYSPMLHYLLVRYVIAEYAPDLVVVNVDMTDDYDDWKYAQTAIYDQSGDPLACPPRDVYSSETFAETGEGAVKMSRRRWLNLYLTQHSYLFAFVRARFPDLPRALAQARRDAQQADAQQTETREAAPPQPVEAAPALPPPAPSGPPVVKTPEEPVPAADGAGPRLYERKAWCRWEWDAFTEANVARTLDLIRRLAHYCQAQGIRLAVTSVPHYEQFPAAPGQRAEWSDRPHREVARIARECGVPYLDSYAAMAPHVVGTRQHDLYYRGDVHFNPRGIALWAQAHVDFLRDAAHQLLPAGALRAD